MQHLPTERLAALGDTEPTAVESAHLADCGACARERDAYRTLLAMAHAEREPLGLPLTRWDSIAEALSAERLVAPPLRGVAGAIAATSTRRRSWSMLPMRVAAGLLLVAGGVIAGRTSAGASALPIPGAVAGTTSAASRDGGLTSLTGAREQNDTAMFGSVDAARDAQLRSEAIYQQAAAYLARYDSTGGGDRSPVGIRAQLAALDQMLPPLQEAMRQAPHDPVINGYYLTAIGQREATIRQLSRVLPASMPAKSY
jgi:hypothetical protein